MRVIAKRVLMEMAQRQGDCEQQVRAWYLAVSRVHWRSLADVREMFPRADLVGDKTVFTIKGNDYRLIVHISYRRHTIYVKYLLTHAEYDRGQWKEEGR